MYLAFKNQNPKTLLSQLKDVNYIWVVLSILFGFFAIVSRAIRWVILLENLGFSVKKLNSIYAVSIGYFTNIAVPRAGEITRCTSLNQTENIPVDKLLGTIILERVIDFIILISLVLVVLILKMDLFLSFFQSSSKVKRSMHHLSFYGDLLLLFYLRDCILIKKSFKSSSFIIK